MKITKKELLEQVWLQNVPDPEHFHLEVKNIVDTLFDQISEIVRNGDSITIPNFGKFERKYIKGRRGRNPHNGKKLMIDPCYKVKFTPSRKLKSHLRDDLYQEGVKEKYITGNGETLDEFFKEYE